MSSFEASAKPSRSDEIISPEEQMAATHQVEAFFEQNAPKRAQKPPRSEIAEGLSIEHNAAIDNPEAERFKLLEKEGGHVVPDVYLVLDTDPEGHQETEYYQDLNAVEKETHHTIGTGFIALDAKPEALHFPEQTILYRNHPSCNPATNEWIPSPAKSPISLDKPARSEGIAL